ncbi:MAG: hypothetical protein EPO07_05035 [Verrucomicrobia bacterium]|nr:MAG: hypothetical protein EPO07_05035 [Verrucomicrobiota bacterium]
MKQSKIFFPAGMLALLLAAGCATPQQTAALVVGGVAVMGARTPSQELEQIYYVGMFDPEEQLPPTVYRLTVRGQASILSNTKFASGWVRAGLIDSLNGRVGLDPNGNGEIEFSQTNTNQNVTLSPGRRLMMFGPEGFREAPRDHRLVIVMGSDPQGFFNAVDGALGEISSVAVERGNAALEKKLFEALITTAGARENLDRLKSDVAADLPRQPQN